MEPPSRLFSPWAHDNSPLPSPGPPPSPAVWTPHEWTPGPRGDLAPSRTLPHIPPSHAFGAVRTNMAVSPLPTHPEFLSNLQSHPLIIQRGDIRDLDSLHTPSPTSSLEFVLHPKPDEKTEKPYSNSPVPFPVSSGYTSPVLCASPRPLPSLDGSQQSVRIVPSVESSPRRTPDWVGGLASPFPSPPRNRPLPKAQIPPPPPLPPQSQFQSPPPPPPLSLPKSQAPPRPQSLDKNPSPQKNGVIAPRPRLPALRGSTGSVHAVLDSGPRLQSTEPSCPKHPMFYMKEGMIVLKVEGSLYKVHKYLLQHHSKFFTPIPSEDTESMGYTDEHPIPLPDNITQDAFDCLLNFLYTGIYDPSSVSLQDWITLLRISTRLQFTKVRQYAIRELTAHRASLAAVDAIILAKEHDIPSWLGYAYAELVRRLTPLNDDEAERLGARTTAQVGRAREVLRAEEFGLHQQRKYGARYVMPERPDEQLVARAVNEVFKLSQEASGAQ